MKRKSVISFLLIFMLMATLIIAPVSAEAVDDAGRTVVIAGSFQNLVGETNWNPGSEITRMHYDGNKMYSLTVNGIVPGTYEYKVAMGTWDENYGAEGKDHGENIKFTVTQTQDVTFWYSDETHIAIDSLNYIQLAIQLTGTGIPQGTQLEDQGLSGIYSQTVELAKGSYADIKAVINGKEYPFSNIEVTDTEKTVRFSFYPKMELAFTDVSNGDIDISKLYFNSRDLKYKTPFGAVPTGKTVTFNLQTGQEITEAKLLLTTNAGIESLEMVKVEGSDADTGLWTVNYTPTRIAMDKYSFAVSDGSEMKVYGDDDGFFGPGTAGDVGSAKQYDLNVYDKNFKTPDWMKNGVMYQIFPDRFFNGDVTNDEAQKLSRGTAPYEFYKQWYDLPENPALEFNKDKTPNPDYLGTKGDGVYCNEMYGGDLKGIQTKLDYLQGLGVTILYLNPVSQSISNHRYDTTDYRTVDPLLGHMDDFVNLAKDAKKRGMHIILDGVFNHVSDDSIYFDRYGKYMGEGKPLGAYQYWSKVYDLMNAAEGLSQKAAEVKVVAELASQGITDLHYKDWFVIGNQKVPATDLETEHYTYEGWWGYASMPVVQALNGSEYNVKTWANEIIDGPDSNTQYWLKQGSSGWRLDVANEVSDETWRNFRDEAKQNPNNVIIGEIWTDASKYLMGDMYDSVMNYRFKDAVAGFVSGNGPDAVKAMNQLEMIREQYPKEAFEVMMNLAGTHDTERIVTTLDGGAKNGYAEGVLGKSLSKMKEISLIQMTYPGTPLIYYGDEAGMAGGADPDDRRGMIWGKGDRATVEWYANLTNMRHAYPVLRTGDVVPVIVDDANKADLLAYSRNEGAKHALVAVNRKDSTAKGVVLEAGTIPDGTVLTNVLNPAEKFTVAGGKVTLDVPGYSGVLLVTHYKAVKINEDALKDAYDPAFAVGEQAE